ncbi:MAG: hypothetical protein H0X38_15700 [Planctomycetes bacterium]|nr:hypothetical protein [Planctomycetota bacterium]
MRLLPCAIFTLLCFVAGARAADPVPPTVTPATTVVVINHASLASAQVAHAWMTLRGIPDGQAVELDGVPTAQHMPLADFRRLVLDPLEVELVRRGRAASTLLVAYGPDFPTAIDFDDAGLPMGARSPASLTGLTLLAPLLAVGPRAFTAGNANPYADQPEMPGRRENLRALADPRTRRADQLLIDKDFPAAEALLAEIARDIPAADVLYNLACVQALGGRAPDALATLGRAVDAGWFDDQHARRDSDLTSLRSDPAWRGLLQRMQDQAAHIAPGDVAPFNQAPAQAGSPPGRLAILLAATTGRGLTVHEAIASLTRSVAADGSRPAGSVYYMASADEARTGPRRWAFAAAAARLRLLGVAAEVLEGNLPPAGAQVAGATLGVADFDWVASGATIQGGAWCDHLTSFGGALQAGAGQTPLTAFLRAGAAGAGGTVAEPLNHPFKFPSAFVHVYRAQGLSLVEAVHRAMAGPYQYLVVGDPLSRPWGAGK